MSTMIYRMAVWAELSKEQKASVRKLCDIKQIDYVEICDYGDRETLHVHLLPEVVPTD